jgi:hypothetical protein
VVPLPPMCHRNRKSVSTSHGVPASRSPSSYRAHSHSFRTVETMAVIYHRSRPLSPRARFAGGSTEGSIGGAAEGETMNASPDTATTCMPTYTMPATPVWSNMYNGIAPPTYDQQVSGDTTGLGVLLESAITK